MIPMIAFVGDKKSGKTLILEQVVKTLTKRQKKIALLKHTAHSFKLDYPETDTARIFQAGAQLVAIAGKQELGLYGQMGFELDPEAVRDLFFPAVEAVLVEGYRNSLLPKIVVSLRHEVPAWARELGGLLAVVSENKPSFPVKHFKPTQINRLADLIEAFIKAHRGKREVKIYLDGKPLQIKPFIKDFFLNTITAMVGSLKGTEGARRIQLTIDLPAGRVIPRAEE